jgi:tetratricopeptide (TPR) repeat protein
MRIVLSLGALGLLLAGCKNPELAAAETKREALEDFVTQGRVALSSGDAETAVKMFKQASANAPRDPALLLLLAQAHRAAGNDAAAVMAVKEAEALSPQRNPALLRERAELYRRLAQTRELIGTLLELGEGDPLTDAELIELARAQAHNGQRDAGYRTLDVLQARKSGSAEARVVEAEILLLNGEDALAARLIDRLIEENPSLVSARILRARYLFQNGSLEEALKDLDEGAQSGPARSEFVELKASLLNKLRRTDEAASLLRPMVEANPRDADLLAQLAETELDLGEIEAAQAKIDQALAIRPQFARGLYVRGRALEAAGDLVGAASQYEFALKADPQFAPALSRRWKLYEGQGQKPEEMNTLERLLQLGAATVDEKVALATLYVDTGNNIDRGRKLINEAVRVQPNNAAFRELRTRLLRAPGGSPPVVIIRKRH